MNASLSIRVLFLVAAVLPGLGQDNPAVAQTAKPTVTTAAENSTEKDADRKSVDVTIRLVAPSLATTRPVFLTGNVSALGNWKPDHTKMRPSGDAWLHSFKVPQGTKLEYKFTLGSWEKEGAQANGRPLPNFRLAVEHSIVHTDKISRWTNTRDGTASVQDEAPVSGVLRYHRDFQFGSLRPRDLVVWLPPGYEKSDRRYGVLYMHDGQNIVDPRTSAFGVDWNVDGTMSGLIEKQMVEPLIIVGIYNTPNRSKEYLVGPIADEYLNLVTDGVKPLIDSHYRTRGAREYTYAAGSSAGGLAAFRLVWERPTTFSGAICMSPAFAYTRPTGEKTLDYISTLRTLPRPDLPITVYLDCGGSGVDVHLRPGIEETIGVLKAKGMTMDQNLHWILDEKAPHNEKAWGERFPQAIQRILGKTPK